jgi:hypothetical protein
VTLGQTVGDRVEIAKGLSAGETIAASPLNELRDGTLVRINK